MITVTKDNPGLFGGKKFINTEGQSDALHVIADIIANKKSNLITVLNKYNIPASEKSSTQELLNGIVIGNRNNKNFTAELAKIASKSSFSNVEDSSTDNTNPNDSTKTIKTVDYGSIINGIGGILSLFNKTDTTGIAQQTNAQILTLAAEKEAARKRNNAIAIAVTIILVVGTITGLVLYYRKKNK